MNINLKPGTKVRTRVGNRITGRIMKPMRWSWRYMTVIVLVRPDLIYGNKPVAFRIGQLEILADNT